MYYRRFYYKKVRVLIRLIRANRINYVFYLTGLNYHSNDSNVYYVYFYYNSLFILTIRLCNVLFV